MAGNYYVVNRMTGKTISGPWARYVDAFNAARAAGPAGMVVEREEEA